MGKSKIIYTTLISIAVAFVIILFPLLFICDRKDAITLGATILSGLAGVLAVIVGLTVYEDVVGKKLLEKNFETVNSFLEEIKSLQIKVACYSGNTLTLFSIIPFYRDSTFLNSLKKSSSIDINETNVVFCVDNYYKAMETLFKLKASVHMPVELIDKLNFIGPRVFHQINIKNLSSVVIIIVNDKFSPNDYDNRIWMEFSDEHLTLKSYFETISEIIKTIENWLQKSTKMKINLNT
jgi:hypothetical protein